MCASLYLYETMLLASQTACWLGFLLIQSGLTDERDDLLDEVAKMEKECAETEKTLDTLIADDSTLLGNADLSLSQDVGK